MKSRSVSRRKFLQQSVAGTAAALTTSSLGALETTKRTAVDLVPLGKTGLKITRLGMLDGDQETRQRTLREPLLQAKVVNPHVVQILGHGIQPATADGPQEELGYVAQEKKREPAERKPAPAGTAQRQYN